MKGDELLRSYGKGAAMLMKMGYKPGTGLGNNGVGIVEPIMPTLRKRGEGIKVDENGKKSSRMMESIVVDDWDYDESDNDDEIDSETETETEERRKSVMPLGFEKSGLYKSEYEIPEIFDLVKDIKATGINVPMEVLEWIDLQRDNSNNARTLQQLKETMWSVLKSSKGDLPKIKYLDFEIGNIHRFIQDRKNDVKILDTALKEIMGADMEQVDLFSLVSTIDGISGCSLEVSSDILDLLSCRISPLWEKAVQNCDVVDIISLGEILDKAVEYLQILQILNLNNKQDFTIYKKRMHNDIENIYFPQFSGVILKPIIKKLDKYFSNEWDVENFNVGSGIIAEVKESDLFPNEVFQIVFLEHMVLHKLLQGVENWEIDENNAENNKMTWLVQWLKDLSNENFEVIVQSVLAKYCKWLQSYAGELDDVNVLDILGLNYWRDISSINSETMENEFDGKVKRSLLKYCVRNLRKDISMDMSLADPWTLVSEESINALKKFSKRVINFKLFGYEQVIYNEVMIPYWIGYMQFYDTVDTIKGYEDRIEEGNSFLRAFVEVFSYVGFLNEETLFRGSILKGLKKCFDHNNLVNKVKLSDGSRRVLEDFPDIKTLQGRRVEDWEILIDRCDLNEGFVDGESQYDLKTGNDEKVQIGNIKDIVFARCEELGISIVPTGKRDGDKQMYEITSHRGKSYEVYFSNKVMFANLGEERRDMPVALDELIYEEV